MTAQGAAADNACRDGAPRGARASSQEARASRDPHPLQHLGPGSSACRPADRKAGLREPIARLPGRLPALHPSPMGEGRKTGDGLTRQPEKHWAGTAERWLNDHTPVIPGRERKLANPESITLTRGYGFRIAACAASGMTAESEERWLNDPRTSIAA